MMSLSVFVLLNNLIHLIGAIFGKHLNLYFLSFSNPIGITSYFVIQIILSYVLSRFLINTKRKADEFLKMEITLILFIQARILNVFKS